MAKSAKAADLDLTERKVASFEKNILEQYELMESKRGSFMNSMRRMRETMASTYEGLAAQGVPQKIAKLHIKIMRKQADLKGLIADLDKEERKIAKKLATLGSAGKEQLALFSDLPEAAEPEVEEEAEETEVETTARKRPGVSGKELTEAEAAGSA